MMGLKKEDPNSPEAAPMEGMSQGASSDAARSRAALSGERAL
jgi:hypothetical protein